MGRRKSCGARGEAGRERCVKNLTPQKEGLRPKLSFQGESKPRTKCPGYQQRWPSGFPGRRLKAKELSCFAKQKQAQKGQNSSKEQRLHLILAKKAEKVWFKNSTRLYMSQTITTNT